MQVDVDAKENVVTDVVEMILVSGSFYYYYSAVADVAEMTADAADSVDSAADVAAEILVSGSSSYYYSVVAETDSARLQNMLTEVF